MLDQNLDVRKKMLVWKKSLETDLAGIIRERIGEEMELLLKQSHQREWDTVILGKLGEWRRKDKVFDAKMAFLVYYNEDIDEEERYRRLNTLNLTAASDVVQSCIAREMVPKRRISTTKVSRPQHHESP
jgi:hypothetical protein